MKTAGCLSYILLLTTRCFYYLWDSGIGARIGNRSPKGPSTPKVLLALGRIRDRICAFRLVKDGIF